MSITEQLQALGMRDLSEELTRERLAVMSHIAASNTLRDELVTALEDLVALVAAEYPQQQETWLANARAAIAKAKETT